MKLLRAQQPQQRCSVSPVKPVSDPKLERLRLSTVLPRPNKCPQPSTSVQIVVTKDYLRAQQPQLDCPRKGVQSPVSPVKPVSEPKYCPTRIHSYSVAEPRGTASPRIKVQIVSPYRSALREPTICNRVALEATTRSSQRSTIPIHLEVKGTEPSRK